MGGEELVSLLGQKDQQSHSAGYKISFIVVMSNNQFDDPNQTKVLKDCAATWTAEGAFAMKSTTYYEQPPVYRPLGSAGYKPSDYHNGNLIVWRSLEEHILSVHDRNDMLQKLTNYLIDPNDQIVETGDNVLLYRFPIDKPYSMYQFNQLEIAMGRGFSKHIGTVKSAKSLSSGLLKVTSQGSHGPGLKGTWELTIDPKSDYLVREALFTCYGMDKPSSIVTSDGVIEKDGIKLAKSGVRKYPNVLEYSVHVTDISKVVGPNRLYEEVLSCLNSPLAHGAQIVDWRGKKGSTAGVE